MALWTNTRLTPAGVGLWTFDGRRRAWPVGFITETDPARACQAGVLDVNRNIWKYVQDTWRIGTRVR